MVDVTVTEKWDGGVVYKCSEKVLYDVVFSVCDEVLHLVWIVYLCVSDQYL